MVDKKKFWKEARKGPVYAFMPTLAAVSVSPELPLKYTDFADVFSEEEANHLLDENTRQHPIELIDGQEPLYSLIYNLSEKELKVLQEYLRSSLQHGWIQQSSSPAGALILFVPKKDSGLQLCMDYCSLNKITVKNHYPLPLISKTLDRL